MSTAYEKEKERRAEAELRGENPRSYHSYLASPEIPFGTPVESYPEYSPDDEVAEDLSPYLKVHKNGWVVKLAPSPPPVAAGGHPSAGVVCSKDVKISEEVSARIYIPPGCLRSFAPYRKLPILVYYHGGGFCYESAFSQTTHSYVNQLTALTDALVVSVNYRLAPENLVRCSFSDSLDALQWVASQSLEQISPPSTLNSVYGFLRGLVPSVVAGPASDGTRPARAGPVEPWLVEHGDFSKLFIGGDDAGGAIAHYISTDRHRKPKLSLTGGVKIQGTILCFPYFVGRLTKEGSIENRLWEFLTDDAFIYPFLDCAGFQFEKMFVCYGENDSLRDVNEHFVKEMERRKQWKGEMTVVEVEDGNHCFQVEEPDTPKARKLINEIASFIHGSRTRRVNV